MEGFFSSDGVLDSDMSESELVGMDDRLEVDGNWFLMFPVSSFIWEGTRYKFHTLHEKYTNIIISVTEMK